MRKKFCIGAYLQHANVKLRRVWFALLLLVSPLLVADGIYLTDMHVKLSPASLAMLTDPARGGTGAQPGDIVEFILDTRVANDPAGPSAYLTAYIAGGVDVLGAWFVTDETGDTPRPPGPGGHGHDGWGPRGDQAPFGAPFEASGSGRQNDLFGDTGIFFSTDSRTNLFTTNPLGLIVGPTINSPNNTAGTSSGYNVEDTFFGEIDAFNMWDADQVNAFGIGGGINTLPNNPSPTSAATTINGTGKGAIPYNSGSPVAGPLAGYKLDNTGAVGPWQRIRYPGSQLADVSDGPATADGVEDSPDQLDASALGFGLNGAGYAANDSTALPSGVNAIRWSDGLVFENDIIYVKVRVRLSAASLSSTEGVISNFEANGSDNWMSGSKDNPWRYFGPSVPVFDAANLGLIKNIVSYNGIAYSEGPIPSAADVAYSANYMNISPIPISTPVLRDVVPAVIATSNCSAANPSLFIATAGVTVTTTSGTSSCPAPDATLTFSNLPNITNNVLGGLRGGNLSYTMKLADDISEGTVFSNAAIFSGNASGFPLSVTDAVSSIIGQPIAPVALSKTVVDLNGGDAEPGDVLRYTLTLSNSLASNVSGLSVTDHLPVLVDNFNLIGIPAGATDVFSPPPAGVNGAGLLQVSDISVDAGASARIAFDVTIVAGAGVGAIIDNGAELNIPSGVNDLANAEIIVKQSLAFASGTKPLYLYEEPELSRAPLTFDPDKVKIKDDGESFQWILEPQTTSTLTLSSGNIPVYIWLKGKDKTEDFSVTVQLTSVGASNTNIGSPVTQIVPLDKNNPALFAFDINLAAETSLLPGSQLVVEVINNHDEDLELFPRFGTHSRLEPELETVIHVNSVDTFDQLYPVGSVKSVWNAGETVFIRSVVSDPFGSADITAANLMIAASRQ